MTRRRLIAALAGALLWGASGGSLLACPICFQIEQGPVTDGVRAAVLVLMGVTVAVLACFGMFIRRLAQAPNPTNPS